MNMLTVALASDWLDLGQSIALVFLGAAVSILFWSNCGFARSIDFLNERVFGRGAPRQEAPPLFSTSIFKFNLGVGNRRPVVVDFWFDDERERERFMTHFAMALDPKCIGWIEFYSGNPKAQVQVMGNIYRFHKPEQHHAERTDPEADRQLDPSQRIRAGDSGHHSAV